MVWFSTVLASIAMYHPRQIISREMQGARLANGSLEMVKVSAVIEGPGGGIPCESLDECIPATR